MATYEVIEHIEVTNPAGQASITFSSIPTDGTYTDIYLVLSGRTTETNIIDFLDVYPNGSTSNLSSRRLSGSGSSESSAANSRNYINASTSTSNTFANLELLIPNYASSNAKSMSLNSVSENNATGAYQNIQATLWNDTTAISSLELNPVYGNFVQYSSATLYGIRKYDTAGSPKATGGIISFDSANNNWVHTFTASGTFTPTENLTCDVLCVAGGGGGGHNLAGGGGAGDYIYSTGVSATASTGYTVTIGGGGAGSPSDNSVKGSNGSNSVFSSTTAIAGGGGGSLSSASGLNGGSGGGGAGGYTTGTGGAGGSSTANGLGNAGGAGASGASSSLLAAGGGGGSGSVGSAGSGLTTGGAGGTGTSNSITGSALFYAGGGGGGVYGSGTAGAGGSGGGGTGGSSSAATNGTPNTGGGGGGGGNPETAGGRGGSGIVIVRYAA